MYLCLLIRPFAVPLKYPSAIILLIFASEADNAFGKKSAHKTKTIKKIAQKMPEMYAHCE